MARTDPTEVLVSFHHESDRARLVSINGENSRAVWIARTVTGSFHLTGQSTMGTDRHGQRVKLPLANMTVPEWLAKDRGFI